MQSDNSKRNFEKSPAEKYALHRQCRPRSRNRSSQASHCDELRPILPDENSLTSQNRIGAGHPSAAILSNADTAPAETRSRNHQARSSLLPELRAICSRHNREVRLATAQVERSLRLLRNRV